MYTWLSTACQLSRHPEHTQPVIRLLPLPFPLLSLFLPLTRIGHKGAEHTAALLTVPRLAFLNETASSHHQVTDPVGNNLSVHIQRRAYKKDQAPAYHLSVVKKKATGPYGIICAQAHDTKPKLNIWPNCSFDCHQKWNVTQPERDSLVDTNRKPVHGPFSPPHWKKRPPVR